MVGVWGAGLLGWEKEQECNRFIFCIQVALAALLRSIDSNLVGQTLLRRRFCRHEKVIAQFVFFSP